MRTRLVGVCGQVANTRCMDAVQRYEVWYGSNRGVLDPQPEGAPQTSGDSNALGRRFVLNASLSLSLSLSSVPSLSPTMLTNVILTRLSMANHRLHATQYTHYNALHCTVVTRLYVCLCDVGKWHSKAFH